MLLQQYGEEIGGSRAWVDRTGEGGGGWRGWRKWRWRMTGYGIGYGREKFICLVLFSSNKLTSSAVINFRGVFV